MIYSPKVEAKDLRVDSPCSSPMRSVTVADSLEAFTESRFTTVTGLPTGHSETDFTSLKCLCETAQGVESPSGQVDSCSGDLRISCGGKAQFLARY